MCEYAYLPLNEILYKLLVLFILRIFLHNRYTSTKNFCFDTINQLENVLGNTKFLFVSFREIPERYSNSNQKYAPWCPPITSKLSSIFVMLIVVYAIRINVVCFSSPPPSPARTQSKAL